MKRFAGFRCRTSISCPTSGNFQQLIDEKTWQGSGMTLKAIFVVIVIACGSTGGWDQFGSSANAQAIGIEQPSPPPSVRPASRSQGANISLRGGWTDFTPFQSLSEGEIEGAQGLDVEILSDIVRAAGMEAQLHKRNWQDQLRDLTEGNSDIAIGAFRPADGDDRFHYSLPYRWARISLYVSHPGRMYGCFLNSSGLSLYQSFMACNGDLLPRADCGSCWL